MHCPVNIQARIQRHARNSLYQRNRVVSIFQKFKVFSAVIVFVLPIYPSFGKVGYNETSVWNYDASSILVSYEGDGQDAESLVSANDAGYIKPAGLIASERDVSGINTLLSYTVASGDSFGSIADKFRVSTNSILWANNFSRDHVIHPGDAIKIPPVTGVVYQVESMDTIDAIAKKFRVDSGSIAKQNHLALQSELKIGQTLVIPNAEPQRVFVAAAKVSPNETKKPTKASNQQLAKSTNKAPAAKSPQKSYAIGKARGNSGFAWGNCTYYVAANKRVTWRGNANQWLRNAAAAGVATGQEPAVGAIVSFAGSGYNPYYGHVGIVVDIQDGTLIVKDMNYRRLNEVTIRRVDAGDSAIKGYIYVD